jgi:membrane dipeptidase
MAHLIVDGHLDLAFNAVQLNRDVTQPAQTVRAHDSMSIQRGFGSATVTLPELSRGGVGIIFATAMSRIYPTDRWTRTGMYSQSQCHGIARGHYGYYEALEQAGLATIIRDNKTLEATATAWRRRGEGNQTPRHGLVLTMESADPILGPDQVPLWHRLGLRMVSLSHYGKGHYAHGTGTEGGLLPPAGSLLKALSECHVIVDLTHTTDQGFWETLEAYDGAVAASHHNCRRLVPGQRQLTDEMIRAIGERDGVIGAAMDAWMLDPSWNRKKPAREQATQATLESVVDHIDHVCQVLGKPDHAAIGTDLDGGYGQEQSPRDLNTVANLDRMPELLAKRGYGQPDVDKILWGNWLRMVKDAMA